MTFNATSCDRSRIILTFYIAFCVFLSFASSGCGKDFDPEKSSVKVTTPNDQAIVVQSTQDATLECVLQAYPCTWAEVDIQVLSQSQDLADEAMARLDKGDTTQIVAKWLQAMPDIGSVLHDNLLIRFRLKQGRPVWVGTPTAAALGIRGPGGSAPRMMPDTRKADPVGAQTIGVRPEKAFLFVDPYRYEFYFDVINEYMSVEDDAKWSLPKLFKNIRDYKCTPGKPCTCPGGECFHYVGNDWAQFCDPNSVTCQVEENVSLSDYKNWQSFDVIHVASHGSQLCDTDGVCGGGIASGQLVRGDLKLLAEAYQIANQGIAPAYAEWLLEPGIELYRLGFPHSNCDQLTSGTPGYSFVLCDSQQRVWRTYLGTDFFKANYKPGELQDKLIFLSSCVSVHKDATLAKYLAGPSNENAVIGWSGYVLNSSASRAATVFYKEWLTGKTAHEAFLVVKNDPKFNELSFEGNRGILRGNADTSYDAQPAALGLAKKRGVETVHLLNPETGMEITDGGQLPLSSDPGDGQPDTLKTMFEVVSVDAEENPEDYTLKVRVNGINAPQTHKFNVDVGDGTYRFNGAVNLGVDLAANQPVNVEISADLPHGGQTRWLYYDLVPMNLDCSWNADVTGGARHSGRGDALWAGVALGGMGKVDLTHRPSQRGTETAKVSMQMWLGPGPLRTGDYRFAMGDNSKIGMQVNLPEYPNAPAQAGNIRLTNVATDHVAGNFEAELPSLETGPLHVSGAFVWTKGCSNGFR